MPDTDLKVFNRLESIKESAQKYVDDLELAKTYSGPAPEGDRARDEKQTAALLIMSLLGHLRLLLRMIELQDDSYAHWIDMCPGCGVSALQVVSAKLVIEGKSVRLHVASALKSGGFEVGIDLKDGSTDEEEVVCSNCGAKYELHDVSLDSMMDEIRELRK